MVIGQKQKSNNDSHVPWVNKKALKAIKRKYHAWKRYSETRSYGRYINYVKERNRVSKKLRQAKRQFEENIAKECKKNPKAFYSYFNSYKKRSTNFIRLKKESDDNLTSDDKETADEFNRYFTSVFTSDQHTVGSNEHGGCKVNGLSSIGITKDDVFELLKSVNTTKSAGDDGIHPRILYECADELVTPIHMIFQHSLNKGTVPDAWKRATITPIHKSEDRAMAGNYRPISITSQLGKLLEKHIRSHLMDYLTESNILSDHQHGFCKSRSCMTNLLEALEEITDMVDEGLAVDQVFLDFRKAFDKVSHSKLLYKLNDIGVKGVLLQWLRSFLTGRLQRVKINGSHSSWGNVSSGVPQGSVLGPTLFVIFINDLPARIRTNCKLFADDSKIYGRAATEEDRELLQEDLNACFDWANLWSMQFHPKKCKVMHFDKDNLKSTFI